MTGMPASVTPGSGGPAPVVHRFSNRWRTRWTTPKDTRDNCEQKMKPMGFSRTEEDTP